MRSMTAIVEAFERLPNVDFYRSKMIVFITVSTNDDTLINMFEGFASSYGERVAVINYLVEHHFYTNVMMEPFVGSNPNCRSIDTDFGTSRSLARLCDCHWTNELCQEYRFQPRSKSSTKE